MQCLACDKWPGGRDVLTWWWPCSASLSQSQGSDPSLLPVPGLLAAWWKWYLCALPGWPATDWVAPRINVPVWSVKYGTNQIFDIYWWLSSGHLALGCSCTLEPVAKYFFYAFRLNIETIPGTETGTWHNRKNSICTFRQNCWPLSSFSLSLSLSHYES